METMLRYHMAVVTPDKRLRRAIKRVTTATASTAEFASQLTALEDETPVDLAILDAREGAPSRKSLSRLSGNTAISYILDGENLISTVDMLEDKRVSSLLCYDETLDDDEFIASATKSLRRDIFGLQKYFPWGVTTYSMSIKNYEQKTRAIEIIVQYARQAGLRGPVRDRIQVVSDELMMNALYHAPVDDEGNELYARVSRKELTKLDEVAPIEVHYGCSGRYFGISVRDVGGSLTREKALEYLMRAKNETTQIETKATGAGLGLISVLRSVSKLIFNLDPGHSTEVIALFDMNLFAKGKVGARSMHIFVADQETAPSHTTLGLGDEDAESPRPRSRRWSVFILLMLLAVALGAAYYVRREQKEAEVEAEAEAIEPLIPSIKVLASPPDAIVRMNGANMQSGVAMELPEGARSIEISVKKRGYKTWTKTFEPGQIKAPIQLYVTLEPRRR